MHRVPDFEWEQECQVTSPIDTAPIPHVPNSIYHVYFACIQSSCWHCSMHMANLSAATLPGCRAACSNSLDLQFSLQYAVQVLHDLQEEGEREETFASQVVAASNARPWRGGGR